MKIPSKFKSESCEKRLLEKTSRIQFQCRPGLPCFTACCRDVNIFLSAYDILRLKNRLGMASGQFLERHTKTLISPSGSLPVIQLKMEGPDKRCPFVTAEGCVVYTDRPWACRMYPLDRTDEGDKYFFVTGDTVCHGRREPSEWVLKDWLMEQRVEPYDEMDRRFQTGTNNPRLLEAGIENPRIQQMFWMACYDLDNFRRFVFESRFLKTFDLEPEMVERARTDDLALLNLSHRWLLFGMVSGDALPIKEEVLKAEKARLKTEPGK